MQALRAGLITDTYFYVHHVQHHHGAERHLLAEKEISRAVKKLSKQDTLYDQLADSLAPEIYGHSDIKKALLLQLVSTRSHALSSRRRRHAYHRRRHEDSRRHQHSPYGRPRRRQVSAAQVHLQRRSARRLYHRGFG